VRRCAPIGTAEQRSKGRVNVFTEHKARKSGRNDAWRVNVRGERKPLSRSVNGRQRMI